MAGFFLNRDACARQDDSRKEPDMQSPFGVLEFFPWNHCWNNYKFSCAKDIEKTARLMKEAGISWVRMDFLWQEIEPEKEKFEFDKYDEIVDVLSKNGLNILGILHYSTDWSSSCGQWNCPSKENSLFVKYAEKVIGHYKDKVKYWEVWNEPDSRTYWVNQDGLKSYCELLKEVYIAAKKIDPSCKVLNGGFANGALSINKLYDNGAKDYFDILNTHIFESPLNPAAIKAVIAQAKLARKIMERNGDGDKPMWITEIGCPGVKRGLKTKDWWQGANPDEAQQAKWLEEIYTQLLREKGVEKVFWAFFRDCKEHWGDGVDYFGVIRWDYSKKPAFKAYKRSYLRWLKDKK